MQRCPVEVILARCAVLRLDLASLGQRSSRARGLSLSTLLPSTGVALSTVQWDVLRKNPKRLSHNESRYLTCRFRKSCAPVLPLSAVSVVASALRATAGAAPCSRRCRRSFPHAVNTEARVATPTTWSGQRACAAQGTSLVPLVHFTRIPTLRPLLSSGPTVRQSTTESANCVCSKQHARSSATIQTDGTLLLSLLPLCHAGSPNAPMNMYGCPKQYNFGAIQHNPKAKELPPMLGRPLAFAWAGRTAHPDLLPTTIKLDRAGKPSARAPPTATRQPCPCARGPIHA